MLHACLLFMCTKCNFQQEQTDGADEDETMSKASQTTQPSLHFHNVALKYLDQYAPVWGMFIIVSHKA